MQRPVRVQLTRAPRLAALAAAGAAAVAAAAAAGCAPGDITFPPMGSASQPSGKGSFRFGASSAATQIEDQDTNTDWYVFTQPAPTAASATAPRSSATRSTATRWPSTT